MGAQIGRRGGLELEGPKGFEDHDHNTYFRQQFRRALCQYGGILGQQSGLRRRPSAEDGIRSTTERKVKPASANWLGWVWLCCGESVVVVVVLFRSLGAFGAFGTWLARSSVRGQGRIGKGGGGTEQPRVNGLVGAGCSCAESHELSIPARWLDPE